MKRVLKNDIIKTMNIINTKINNNCINESDMNEFNKVDNTITKCMLKSENKLKHSSHFYPWSPKLAYAILEVRLWKIIYSSIYNTHNKSSRIKAVLYRMQLLSVSSYQPTCRSRSCISMRFAHLTTGSCETLPHA